MAFRKPGKAKLGLKVLFWGYQGSGKTQAGLTFPSIAAIDAENGMSFYETNEIGKNLVLVENTQSYDELKDSIEELMDISEEEGVETLLEDSTTKFYENIQQAVLGVEEKRARQKGRDVLDTNLSVRSWGKIKQIVNSLQNLKIDLSSRGVNVVTIAQAKDVKKTINGESIRIGEKPDMRDSSLFDYDIEVYMYAETDDSGKVKYLGRVIKDRTNVFKRGDIIENVSYDLWKDKLNLGSKVRPTSFTKGNEEAEKAYEKEVVAEEQSYEDRVTKLMSKWKETKDTQSLDSFKAALTAAKLKGFTGLSPKAEEKLKAILDKFEGK